MNQNLLEPIFILFVCARGLPALDAASKKAVPERDFIAALNISRK
jgi:hypothetical protein